MTNTSTSSHVIAPIILILLLAGFFIHSSTAIYYLPLEVTSYDALRWIQLIVLGLSSLIALSSMTHFRIHLFSISIFSATILIMLFSLFMIPSIVGAAETLLISLLFISGSILSQKLSESKDIKYIEIVALGFLIISILYIAQTLSALLAHCIYDLKCDTIEGNYLGFANKRQFNHIQIGLLPFSVWLSITCQNTLLRRCATITSAFLIWMLIALDARGAFIAIVLSCVLVSIWYRWPLQHWLHILKLATASLIFWGITKTPTFLYDPTATSLTIRTNSAGRFELWQGTFADSFNNVWLGNGPGSFAVAGGAFSTPHNIILQVAHDYGYIVALSCIIWILAVSTSSLKQPRNGTWVLPWAILGWLFYSLVSNPQTSPLGQTLFLIITILMFSGINKKRHYAYALNKKMKIIFGLFFSILLFLISYTYIQISSYEAIRSAPRLFSHH